MENYKLFIALDQLGWHHLLQTFQHITQDPTEKDVKDKKKTQYAIVTYPSFLDLLQVDDLPDILFEWCYQDDTWDSSVLPVLKKIDEHMQSGTSDKEKPRNKKDDEYIAESIHELADLLPVLGTTLLEVFIFGKKNLFAEADLSLLSSLKRFEILHPTFFGLVCIEQDSSNADADRVVWKDFLDFHFVTVSGLVEHFAAQPPLWAGGINVRIQQSTNAIPLQYSFLYESKDNEEDAEDVFSLRNQLRGRRSYDNKIEIVATAKFEQLPWHLIKPHKYTLQPFCSSLKQKFNFFQPNHFFLGLLKHTDRDTTKKFTTDDWKSLVEKPWTSSLDSLYDKKKFPEHHALLIQYDESLQLPCVHFFYPQEEINVQGVLQLLKDNDIYDRARKHCSTNCNNEEMKFYTNAADVVPLSNWCERKCWEEGEQCSRIGRKPLIRLKSEELNRVMIPGVKPLENKETDVEDKENNLLDFFLTIFEKDGSHAIANLQSVPILEDRLLKNMKNETALSALEYVDAKNLLGHGLDYCVDSSYSEKLSERLSKVQHKFIPLDTINTTTGNLSESEKALIATTKKNLEKENQKERETTLGDGGKRKESRSAKTKRRLWTIVEGTILKYGRIDKDDERYNCCCQALFDRCVVLVKQLKTTKDLNNQMKTFAKAHVKEAVRGVKSKTS